MLKITVIQNDDDLRAFWPDIRKGLEIVLQKNPAHWMPEDIFHGVKTGALTCVVGETERSDFAAFMVLNMKTGIDGKAVFILAFHNAAEHGSYESNWESFKHFCETTGAHRLTMLSSRPGWGKLATRLGFNPVETLYELQL